MNINESIFNLKKKILNQIYLKNSAKTFYSTFSVERMFHVKRYKNQKTNKFLLT